MASEKLNITTLSTLKNKDAYSALKFREEMAISSFSFIRESLVDGFILYRIYVDADS